MFRNLNAEMARAGHNQSTIAKSLKCSQSTLSLKLNGKAPISLEEALTIKQILNTDIPLEELFRKD